jgi:tripartite-type tricarboxylate transporter receptor subunit TctC
MLVAALALLAGLDLRPHGALAQGKYPEKPIRIIVPFAPGGAADILGRLLAHGLTDAFAQTVVIENRPGAGSNVGAAAVARSEPDGYTLLLASSAIIASPALYRSLSYDISRDLAPVAELVSSTIVIVAGPKAGIDSIADMVRQAKADPDRLNYASPGTGTTPQLAMELLKLRAQIKITHVVFGGAAPATQAILAQTVELGTMALSAIHAQIQGGTFKGLAVTGMERWHDLPDIPTVEQCGYQDFDLETVFILMAPRGTPQEILDRLSHETIAVLDRGDARARIENAGFAILARGPDALKARIAREVPMYKDIVAKAGIPVN